MSTAKTAAQAAIATIQAVSADLSANGSTYTVPEIERAIGDARAELQLAIDGLVSAYGVRAADATRDLRALGLALQTQGRRLIDEGLALSPWTVPSDMPLAIAAHLLYGDVSRAPEIQATNRLVDPNRVPAGTVLQVRPE